MENSLGNVLKKVKQSFTVKEPVDFDEFGLHFELEPMTSAQEIEVGKRCEKLEGIEYFDMLKRVTLSLFIKKINDIDLSKEKVEVTEGSFKNTHEYLEGEIASWNGPLKDKLFEAYTSMYEKFEDKIDKSAKFEKFEKPIPEKIEEEQEPEFTEMKKEEEREKENLTPTEEMEKEVEKEVEKAQAEIDNKKS